MNALYTVPENGVITSCDKSGSLIGAFHNDGEFYVLITQVGSCIKIDTPDEEQTMKLFYFMRDGCDFTKIQAAGVDR